MITASSTVRRVSRRSLNDRKRMRDTIRYDSVSTTPATTLSLTSL